jgi:class I fructose-bisphosphate aldolase/fructose-bisphosphate aldolase/2-amino-3,7-dideoxy-D-threo-hept-6-ulosonate synthase
MSTASAFRWSRFLKAESGRGLIVPIDHGLTSGPIDGIASMSAVREWITHPAVDGIILHKGCAQRLFRDGLLNGKAVCIHLNGTTTLAAAPAHKEMLTTVEAAIRLAADAVSLDLVFDGLTDSANLRTVGSVVDEAEAYQVPLLVMLKTAHAGASPRDKMRILRQLCRSMAELGVRAVKLPRPENAELLPEFLDGIAADVNVFFAGGERESGHALLEFVPRALNHGARGFCIGRNVFQSPVPRLFLDRLAEAIHGKPRVAMAVA